MTNNQKIILGVGALALAYYFYTKSKGGSVVTQSSPNTQNTVDNPCPQGQELIQPNCFKAPCPKICADIPKSEPRTIPHAYRLKEDFSGSVMTRPNVYVNVTFKKGRIISALRNPYLAQPTAVGMGALSTTTEGGLPDFKGYGQIFVNIPERILEKI
jgi:hypothetical protein